MALAAICLVAGLAVGRVTERADNVIFDTLAALGARPPHPDIVIVAIDNRSLAELGRWPWPRALHGEMLDQLAKARPKAVAYDVLFVEPDPADADLATAVRRAGPLFLPMTFETPGPNGAPYAGSPPVKPLRTAAAGLGQVNVDFDADGVIRRTYLIARDGDRIWPHLMELTRRAALDLPPPPAADPLAPARAELVRQDPVLIAFAGPPGHFRTISFVDVLRGETPPGFLNGKLVLVGATADGMGDRYATPLSHRTQIMSGVELQANLLDTQLTGRAIAPLTPPQLAALSLLPITAALAGFLLLRPRANLLLGGLLIVATLAISALLLTQARIWAPPTAALAGLLLVYPLWSWRRLEATSAYMLQELRAFSREPDVLAAISRSSPGLPTDVIDRQVELMHAAIDRARNLRRLVIDALQGLPDATLVVALDGRVLIANREAEALFGGAGVSPAERPVSELIAALAPDTPRTAVDLGPPTDLELTLPDGRSFHLRRTGLTEAAGEPIGWIVRFTDITALQAAGRQRERILELLTHDMRSPQVSILTLLGGAQPLGAETAARIGAYARRTLSLADNFVNLARAEGEAYALEPVDLADVLLDAVDDLWPQSQARRITVAADGCEVEALVEADRSLLTRAFINLIDNAIKYSPEGGRVECRLRIDVDGRVTCTVADGGCGMTQPQLASLFKRFQRARPADRVDGVGLGLSFVHAVIQRHGGTIACDSTPGAGTTFTVALPLAN